MNNHSDPKKIHRLRAMLEEDTGSLEDAAALLPAIRRLQNLSVVESQPQQVTRLIESLLPDMPRTESRRERWTRAWSEWWPWLLLRSQARVVRSEIWLASLLIITLGTLVTLLRYDPSTSSDQLPLVLVSPVITAMGIAYIYGPDVDPPLELMLATPVSPRLILLARLTLVFSFNLSLGIMGSVVLAIFYTPLSVWPLVIAWLAPMAFLSALAFCMGVVSRESMLSALASFLLWFLHITKFPSWLPDLLAASARPYLLLAAAILTVFAIWLAGSEERWIGEHI